MHIGKNIHFFSFFSDLASYKAKYFKRDLFSAFTVALLAIPQSIAYSILAGLPPVAGLYSAIFGTLFCSVFCSSRHLVSGPTTAIAILIQSSVSDILTDHYGTSYTDENVLMVLTHLVFTIGVIQIGVSFLNIEKILQFISRSVILGYFAGVALAIFINQLYPLLGIGALQGDYSVFVRAVHLLKELDTFSLATVSLGLISLLSIIFVKRRYPKFPGAILVISGASLLCMLPFFQDVAFLQVEELSLSPKFVFPFTDFHLFIQAFPSASAIALLAILEVYSVSRAFGAKSGQNILVNQEMFAIGTSNLLLSFIYIAMPASGSASRSSLNFQNGAKTRFSALLSALFVLGAIWFAFPLMAFIPIASLAALLIATVLVIIDFDQVKIALKSTKGDFLAFGLTLLSCFFFRLDIAFFIGIVISIAFYLKKAAEPHLVEYVFNEKGRLVIVSSKDDRTVRIIGYAGELFFGVADFFQKTLQTVAENPSVRVIILRLNGVYHVDASICFALLRLSEYMRATNRHLVITGVTPEVLEVFKKASIYKQIGEENFFLTDEAKPQLSTWLGCLRAKELLSKR